MCGSQALAVPLSVSVTAENRMHQSWRCSLNWLPDVQVARLRRKNLEAETMASSVWSGYLTFGLISMPVRLFSGARSSGISFNQLHRSDMQRVKQQLICPLDQKVLDRSEIVKGYEYRKNEYVVVEPDEIKKIEPQTAKTMEILEFVK